VDSVGQHVRKRDLLEQARDLIYSALAGAGRYYSLPTAEADTCAGDCQERTV